MKYNEQESFPNTSIVEAICEFHFTSNDLTQSDWDGRWYGRLHSKLGENYEMEPKTSKGLIVQTSSHGKSTLKENLVPLKQMLYRHKTIDKLIQLAPWLLTINEIGNYPSWKVFLDHNEYAWKSLTPFIELIEIKSIGLRYINRIQKPETGSQDVRDVGALVGYYIEAGDGGLLK